MWWVVPALIFGLILFGSLVIYLSYRLRTARVKGDPAYRLFVSQLVMCVVFFLVSAAMLPIALKVVEEGTTVYSVLIYTAGITVYIGLALWLLNLYFFIVRRRLEKSKRAASAEQDYV